MKILMLGDSPYLRTGFGVVNAIAVDALLSAGHELVVLGGQDTTERDDPRLTFIPVNAGTADTIGWLKGQDVIEQFQPDAIHIIADPATVTAWLLIEQVRNLPVVAYMPVEGAPLNYRWVKLLQDARSLRLITCSNYGVDVLKSEGFDATMAYHGVGEDFTQAPAEDREEMRRALGWDDKFIVMSVAQNVERKQWPRLFEAIKLLKRHSNIYLYAHTVPFDNFYLGGHDLPQLAVQMGVEDRVIFSPFLNGHNGAVELHAEPGIPGLVDLYNSADMFALVSQVEGFGLPLAEAMACGLPVATTGYAAGAEVVGKAGLLIEPSDWEYHKSHSRYANVSPRGIADAIERVYKSPEYAGQLSRRSLERAKTFTWDSYRNALVEAFDEVRAEVFERQQGVSNEDEEPSRQRAA